MREQRDAGEESVSGEGGQGPARNIELDRLRAVLEGLGEGVLALSPTGEVTHSNGAALRLLGK